jgi:hypothetical protein
MRRNKVFFSPLVAKNWFEQDVYDEPIFTSYSFPFDWNNLLTPGETSSRSALLE